MLIFFKKPNSHFSLINLFFASATFSADLISLITLSIFDKAIVNPSKICNFSFALLSSNKVLLVTTSILWDIKEFNICFKLTGWGLPSTKATIFIENDVLICVCVYKLLRITGRFSPFFNSITIRIPSLSDSSLNSDMPSIFLSLTSSAIFSISLALLTW